MDSNRAAVVTVPAPSACPVDHRACEAAGLTRSIENGHGTGIGRVRVPIRRVGILRKPVRVTS